MKTGERQYFPITEHGHGSHKPFEFIPEPGNVAKNLGYGVSMRVTMILCLWLSAAFLFAQEAVPPSQGDGSDTNPYQISSFGNLLWLMEAPSE